MRNAFARQAGRTCIALAAMTAIAALGVNGAQAEPAFASASISIAAGKGGGEGAIPAAGLTCSWRETGLFPYQMITYACDAAIVGAVQACVYKNKVLAGSPTQFTYFRNPQASLEGGLIGLVSNNSGRINGTTTTAVPESEGHGGHLCTEPAVAEVVAVRWCNAWLSDTVNNLKGAEMGELYRQFYPGAFSVPSCAELQQLP